MTHLIMKTILLDCKDYPEVYKWYKFNKHLFGYSSLEYEKDLNTLCGKIKEDNNYISVEPESIYLAHSSEIKGFFFPRARPRYIKVNIFTRETVYPKYKYSKTRYPKRVGSPWRRL